jgi:hypothetical protein
LLGKSPNEGAGAYTYASRRPLHRPFLAREDPRANIFLAREDRRATVVERPRLRKARRMSATGYNHEDWQDQEH